MMLLTILTVMFVAVSGNLNYIHSFDISGAEEEFKCAQSCKFTLVESVPENLTYPATAPIMMSTYKAHKRLLERVKKTLYLSSCYWTLLGSDTDYHDYSSYEGEDIFKNLYALASAGQVSIKIAQNNSNNDTGILKSVGAEVRTPNFEQLMHAGILHTKMWIADEAHVYIGSGNFDWRSYTQTKETGVLIEDCPCLGEDAAKIFEVYWYLGKPGSQIPQHWPPSLSTSINISDPTAVNYNNTKGEVYISSSPPPFCPSGRSNDIDAIVNVIRSAKKFIYISVMDYLPQIVYTEPRVYWPVIDNELRKAAFNSGVKVYLLASHWKHTLQDMYAFLRSLDQLHTARFHKIDIFVKLFTVPADESQAKIPYSRVDHSKYMVTDQHAYIGTSNWSGDYFKYTGGVGFILRQADEDPSNLRQQLVQLFLRDWNSEYSQHVYRF
ncbi:phospholipase D3 [Elysia marginata]|uniref:Phospholipase D3 n=1 Tax=Elysia marginata TaxID=1093978 RepID=A0AAV4EVY2_9GAST|nr:phospholipase D3 [Elysia marginata]